MPVEQKGKENTGGGEDRGNLQQWIQLQVQFVASSFQTAQQEATLPSSSCFDERKTHDYCNQEMLT